MDQQAPLHDSSATLMERTRAYVRESRVLQWALVITCINHLMAVGFVIVHWVDIQVAGFLVLLSVLTWFFAVALPVMNREVRRHMEGLGPSYFGELVERFARVVLYGQTLLYTIALIYAATYRI